MRFELLSIIQLQIFFINWVNWTNSHYDIVHLQSLYYSSASSIGQWTWSNFHAVSCFHYYLCKL